MRRDGEEGGSRTGRARPPSRPPPPKKPRAVRRAGWAERRGRPPPSGGWRPTKAAPGRGAPSSASGESARLRRRPFPNVSPPRRPLVWSRIVGAEQASGGRPVGEGGAVKSSFSPPLSLRPSRFKIGWENEPVGNTFRQAVSKPGVRKERDLPSG